ncbi:MAG: threonine dehydrogenase-like Zn-dependent dehydrogenase [Halioglobus sp.]|jgi:threonine dehydrogenase-like Zn-dependent dehydrogenase
MQALLSTSNPLRLVATKLLSNISARAFVGWQSPMQLREIPEPVLPAPDWLEVETRLCGLCGSDYKQVFMNGRVDNPMTSMISWPQVLGHEVVGVVSRTGDAVHSHQVGQRVLLNPWLSCVTRGLEPCDFCQKGKLAQCLNFGGGTIERGIHHGNSASATGGFAQRVPGHHSQWFPIPDEISDEEAVLGDPFAVSFHAILKAPPPENGTALVYGCGTLGLLAIAILRAVHPTVTILAVARYDHQEALAKQFGAHLVLRHQPTKKLVQQVAVATESALNMPWMGLPMLNGGVDVVYDTVSSAQTIEVDLRITRSFGSVVIIGVEPAKSFEWTPLYFKEINIVGSNGFGIETFEGQRKHAMEWYFDFIAHRGLDVTPIITHRYPMRDYRDAFMSCHNQGKSGAVKVLFNAFS